MIGLYIDIFLIAAGPFIGSFITASAIAWPDWSKVVKGRSACGSCGHALRPVELIPVFSYLIQKGQCQSCREKIWPLHPVGEGLALCIPITSVILLTPELALIASLMGWTLLFASLVDIRTLLLPDAVTLGLIPVGLCLSFWQGGWPQLQLALLGSVIGFASLFLIAFAYHRLTGKEGLGMGDAKLLAAGGALTGPFALAWIVAIGAGITLLAVLAMRLGGRSLNAQTPVALGPGLAAGIFIAYLLTANQMAGLLT